MNKINKIIWGLTLFLSLVLAPALKAETYGLFVEPALTYERTDSDVNYPSPFANSSGDIEGFGVGARAGFHLGEIFFLGIDGRYSMLDFENSVNSYDADASAINWGPVVGVQMPFVGLRVWGSYIVGGELDPDASNGLDVKFSDLSGYRVGAGVRILMVSLNLEYQDLKYEDTEIEQWGPFTPGTSLSGTNLNTESWILSVSFPIEL